MELLTGVLRGEITEPFITPGGKKFEIPARISDRLRAAELLLKIYGKFSEKVEVKVDSMERYIAALEEVWSGKVKPDVG